MFYCDACARKHDYPKTFMKSQGECEICKTVTKCNSRPSHLLPDKKVTFTHENLIDINKSMRQYGGSFIKALAEAWSQADMINKKKLQKTFGNYWLDYYNQYVKSGD